MEKIFEEILDFTNDLKIIDTHEHLPSSEEFREKDTDIIKEYMSHYFDRDLVSAGLPMEDRSKIADQKLSIIEKWKIVEPYWEVSRFTGYGRALDIAAQGLYGIDRIERSTIEKLNSMFLETLKPGYFKKVLKDKCKIVTSLLNVETLDKDYNPKTERSIHCDRELYSPVYSIGNLVFPDMWTKIEQLEKQSGLRITSFDRWLEATEILIDKACSLGSVALKNHLAYLRSLNYERVSRSRAEEEFNNIFKTKHIPDWEARSLFTGKAFQDYMFHYILDIANRKNLVVQIHTGIQEGNGNTLSNSNPELLSNLFLQYPDVTFDIFHMSYPYQNELTVLAKNFPNVFIDMCWAHILSPNASVAGILEWIDMVPINKISAFGGDYLFVDGVYGHQFMARVNVAKALSIKVKEGLFDIDKAKEISGMFFYDNPAKIFRLDGHK
ncbi:MAG: amidohydrolase family protein [Actinomycetota bacterium]